MKTYRAKCCGCAAHRQFEAKAMSGAKEDALKSGWRLLKGGIVFCPTCAKRDWEDFSRRLNAAFPRSPR